MKWKKSSDELVARFEAIMPGPPTVIRKMFGYPAGFINGNMFMGLFQESMVLRLPEESRLEIMKAEGAKPFEPMRGRPMREYVEVPPSVLLNRAKLSRWVAKALEHGGSLEPKSKSQKPAKKKKK